MPMRNRGQRHTKRSQARRKRARRRRCRRQRAQRTNHNPSPVSKGGRTLVHYSTGVDHDLILERVASKIDMDSASTNMVELVQEHLKNYFQCRTATIELIIFLLPFFYNKDATMVINGVPYKGSEEIKKAIQTAHTIAPFSKNCMVHCNGIFQSTSEKLEARVEVNAMLTRSHLHGAAFLLSYSAVLVPVTINGCICLKIKYDEWTESIWWPPRSLLAGEASFVGLHTEKKIAPKTRLTHQHTSIDADHQHPVERSHAERAVISEKLDTHSKQLQQKPSKRLGLLHQFVPSCLHKRSLQHTDADLDQNGVAPKYNFELIAQECRMRRLRQKTKYLHQIRRPAT